VGKKLTEGQKKARACVRDAARAVLREVDAYDSRRNAVEFTAWFHLDCIMDQSQSFDKPLKTVLVNWPVFPGSITRR
jgi:hypothetical protein